MSIYKKLLQIQIELKAPKNQYNQFGKFWYRNCEDILEELKPILQQANAILYISDELVVIGERYYVKAIVTLIDIETGETVSNTAYAREDAVKKGMDGSQITGAASSYARKYALNGLFNINDTRDSDALPPNDAGLPGLKNPPDPSKSLIPPQTDGAQQPKLLTEPQIKRFFAKGMAAGYSSPAIKEWIEKKYQKSVKELTKQEYEESCALFDKQSAEKERLAKAAQQGQKNI